MSTIEVNENAPVATTDTGSQLTAENRSIKVDSDTLVYRRFGNRRIDAPLVCLQHFRGNLDFWDPTLVGRIARDRQVILLANRVVGASTGVMPDNVTDMARDVLLFADALGLGQIDLLGFSLGGDIVQELALLRPRLVRRIVLAGTAPQGGPDLHRWTDDVYANACADEMTAETALIDFFSGSKKPAPKAWSTSSGRKPDRPTATHPQTWRPAMHSSRRSRRGRSPTPPGSTASQE